MRGRRKRAPRGRPVPRVADTRGLLAAKFARPQVPPALIVRQRLLDRLDEAARGEVTLIVAGPGYGKTLLVAAWADTGRPPGHVAWLSLDRYDDSPAAFWSYFLGALRSTGAVPEENPLASIVPGARVDEAFIRRIALGIAELPEPVVLVLEDLHEIVNPQVLRSLAFLLRHPVRQLLLVVTTREEHPTAVGTGRGFGSDWPRSRPRSSASPWRRPPSCWPATAFSSPRQRSARCSAGPRAGRPAWGSPRCS